jgi:hypothetical protein
MFLQSNFLKHSPRCQDRLVCLLSSLKLVRKVCLIDTLVLKVLIHKVKVKVKFTLEQTTKTQRGSRGIAILFPQPRG